MQDSIHICIVEDDLDVRETFEEYLRDHGFRVTALGDGRALRELVASGEIPDLVLLDIMMPGEDGLSLARYLSAETTASIIMVTASCDIIDRVVGLELGADDYLPKPVDLRELLARVKAVLRRLEKNVISRTSTEIDQNEFRVRFGECQLDLSVRKLFDEDGREIRISAMEFDLLKVFSERPNRVLSRDSLLDLAHKGDADPFDRSIDIRVSRLRKKIEKDPGKPEILKTVRGSGYVFVTQ